MFFSRYYAGGFEEAPHGAHGTFVRHRLRMRPMKDGPNAIQDDPYARSSSLTNFRTCRHQHGLDVRPTYVGLGRIVENGFERLPLSIVNILCDSDI